MLKIMKEIIKLKTKSYLIFRVDILFNFLSQMLLIFFYILLFRIIFLKVENIGGWNESEVLVLLGTYYLLNELHGRLFRSGLYKLPEVVMEQALENYLILPINVPLFLLLSEIDLIGLWRIIPGVFVIYYGLSTVKNLSLVSILLYILSLSLSLFIYTLIMFCITTLSFWFRNVNNIFYIFYDISEFAKYPESVYRGVIRYIFLTFIPIIVFTSFPTMIILNKGNINLLIYQLLLFLSIFFISHILWKTGLKRYEGRG